MWVITELVIISSPFAIAAVLGITAHHIAEREQSRR